MTLPKLPKILALKNTVFLLSILAVSSFLLLVKLVSPAQASSSGIELLTLPWTLSASKGASEKYQQIPTNVLQNQDTLKLTYNLHGLCLLPGDASAVVFDQPQGSWHYISLSNYGKNCYDGEQTVNIPLSAFSGLNLSGPASIFHVRFWSAGLLNIDLLNAAVGNTTPAPSSTPPSGSYSWPIQSVSSMKETKDKICGQDSQSFINSWLDKAKELGVNYVAVETPYDSPSCGNVITYAKTWIDAIRARGLKVWHRHMPLAFESIYNTPKTKSDFFNMISSYIKNNSSLFAEGDIFTPIPEPQNGGISGVTGCANNVCQFSSASDFNSWLRSAMATSANAFQAIGLGGQIKIGYFGFDGFVAWGDNNPDWHGILENATIAQMGNITIDHYPQLVNDTMFNDLNELQAKYPNVPIVIGEWGAVGTTDPIQQVIDNMGAARRPGVVGFNYWHMGMGGNEALINSDFSEKPDYVTVQSYFKHTI